MVESISHQSMLIHLLLIFQLEIVWEDGHRTELDKDWLMRRAFSGQVAQDRILEIKGPEKILWGSDLEFPTHKFPEILSDDKALYYWVHGKAVLRSAQSAPNQAYLCRSLGLWADHRPADASRMAVTEGLDSKGLWH